MVKVTFVGIDDYIAAQPTTVRPPLEKARRALAKALPGAEEAISYGIPTFKADGRSVIHFAGWKAHYSLYPVSEDLVSELRDKLCACTFSKGTIRFPYDEPVPMKWIGKIAKLRAAVAVTSTKTKLRR